MLEEIRDVVAQALEKKGSFSLLRAQLRAHVFIAIDEYEQSSTGTGLLLTQLVREFLECMSMEFTQLVYNPEIGTSTEQQKSRSQLASEMGLAHVSPGTPLLLAIMTKPQTAVVKAPISLSRPTLPRLDIQLVAAQSAADTAAISTGSGSNAPALQGPAALKPAISPKTTSKPIATATPSTPPRKSADGSTVSPKPAVAKLVSPKPSAAATAAAAAAKEAFVASRTAAKSPIPAVVIPKTASTPPPTAPATSSAPAPATAAATAAAAVKAVAKSAAASPTEVPPSSIPKPLAKPAVTAPTPAVKPALKPVTPDSATVVTVAAPRPSAAGVSTAAQAAAAAAASLATAAAAAAVAAAKAANIAAETAAKTAAAKATATAAVATAKAKTAAATAAAVAAAAAATASSAPAPVSPEDSYEDDIEDDEGLGVVDVVEEEEDFYDPMMAKRSSSSGGGATAPVMSHARLEIERSELELSDSGSLQSMVGRLRPTRPMSSARSGGGVDLSADIMAGDRSFGASHELGEYSHQGASNGLSFSGELPRSPESSSTNLNNVGSSVANRWGSSATAPGLGAGLGDTDSFSMSGLSTGPGVGSLRPTGTGLTPLQPLGSGPGRLTPLAPLGSLGKSLAPLRASSEELLGSGSKALLAPPTRRSSDLETERDELRRLGLLSSSISTTNTATPPPPSSGHLQHSHDTSNDAWSEVSSLSGTAHNTSAQARQPSSGSSSHATSSSHLTTTGSAAQHHPMVAAAGQPGGRGVAGLAGSGGVVSSQLRSVTGGLSSVVQQPGGQRGALVYDAEMSVSASMDFHHLQAEEELSAGSSLIEEDFEQSGTAMYGTHLGSANFHETGLSATDRSGDIAAITSGVDLAETAEWQTR